MGRRLCPSSRRTWRCASITTSRRWLSSAPWRINKAWDDPAGLAVSEKFRAQISSMVEAERNTSQGINLLATAEGAMAILDEKLIRMRSLSVEAANGTLTSLDRSYLDVEFQQLKSEITRIASVTNYNGLNLLDGTYSQGSASGGIQLQVGTYSVNNVDSYKITINNMTASALGIGSVVLTDTAAAQSAITLVDSAINTKDTERTRIGSFVERLQFTIQNLQVQHENAVDSESTIRDADMAEEMSSFVRAQILMQSGVAMLAQANQIPRLALSLI
jgi:flagellin